MTGTPDTGSPVTAIYDVAIVGHGPVGCALAILLAKHGHSVVVLERWPHRYLLPRAVHLDHEAARIVQACGLGDDLASITEPADVYEWQNATGTTLLRIGRDGPGSSGWPASSMFCQPEFEGLLERRAAALPGIDVRRGCEVVGLDDNGGVVTLSYRPVGASPVASDEQLTVRARFAVGCDGANSTVRQLAGIPVHDLGFNYDWLIVDVILDEDRIFDPINVQICDPARPTTAVSGGPGRRRWEFMRLPGETIDDLNSEATAWRLLEPWDVTPTNAKLERHAVYTFQARWAERWSSGRVLLAGDAAHQMPPFAGQGLCSGLRDAANLAWKLDLVLSGRAPAALLDTYDAERLDHVRAVIDFSMALGRIICVADPAEAGARDAAMSAEADGRLTDTPALPGLEQGIVRQDSVGAGQLFVQGTVDVDGRRVRFDDHFGVGWRLVGLAGTCDWVDGDLAAWFAGLGGTVVAIDETNDPDGTYRTWFDRHGVVAALQRPDFYVYGTARTPGDVDGLISALRDSLAASVPRQDVLSR